MIFGTPEDTFPFQYLAEKKLDSILFKRDLNVEDKNDIISHQYYT